MDGEIQVRGKQAYVNFAAEIIPHTAESLMAAMSNLVNAGVSSIYLMLSTPGGSVPHGITLYNFLRSLPCPLVIHNIGNVDSIGNAVFLAADVRYASPHSTFMFHGVGWDMQQGTRLEEKQVKEILDGILSSQKRIGDIVQERSSIKAEDIGSLFLEAKTLDAATATSLGIVHELRDVKIPPGAPVISLVFQR